MDKIILHPQAQNLLFKYYRVLRIIFNDVLGHLEIDYLSIGLLNNHHQICFLSSMPAIEQNLIQHQVWQSDPVYQEDFFNQQDILIWTDTYQDDELYRFKLAIPKFAFAISLPSVYEDFQVNYSFGLKSDDPYAHIRLLQNTDTLLSIGKYALSKILNIVRDDIHFKEKPYLKLIVNQ